MLNMIYELHHGKLSPPVPGRAVAFPFLKN